MGSFTSKGSQPMMGNHVTTRVKAGQTDLPSNIDDTLAVHLNINKNSSFVGSVTETSMKVLLIQEPSDLGIHYLKNSSVYDRKVYSHQRK